MVKFQPTRAMAQKLRIPPTRVGGWFICCLGCEGVADCSGGFAPAEFIGGEGGLARGFGCGVAQCFVAAFRPRPKDFSSLVDFEMNVDGLWRCVRFRSRIAFKHRTLRFRERQCFTCQLSAGDRRAFQKALRLLLIGGRAVRDDDARELRRDRKSTRLNSSHGYISYAVFCLKKKT